MIINTDRVNSAIDEFAANLWNAKDNLSDNARSAQELMETLSRLLSDIQNDHCENLTEAAWDSLEYVMQAGQVRMLTDKLCLHLNLVVQSAKEVAMTHGELRGVKNIGTYEADKE